MKKRNKLRLISIGALFISILFFSLRSLSSQLNKANTYNRSHLIDLSEDNKPAGFGKLTFSHSLEEKTFTISGTAYPNEEVRIFSHDSLVTTLIASPIGYFEFLGELSDNEDISYRFESMADSQSALIPSIKTLRQVFEESEMQRKIDAEARGQYKVFEEDTSNTTSLFNEPIHEKVKVATAEQRLSLVSLTRHFGKEHGVDIPYSNEDSWQVSLCYTNEKNQWLVTTSVPRIGHVRSIFEWTGNKQDTIILKYLQIGGSEYFNELHD